MQGKQYSLCNTVRGQACPKYALHNYYTCTFGCSYSVGVLVEHPGYVHTCSCIYSLLLVACTSLRHHVFVIQLIAGDHKNMSFLLTLCDFAVEHKLQTLRDSIRNLLKLLPTGRSHDCHMTWFFTSQSPPLGIQLWSETLEYCKKCLESGPDKAYENLRKYVISSSPSKTLYLLEVRCSFTLFFTCI